MTTQPPLFDFRNSSTPTLDSLEPSRQASYSPALYLWLRKNAHFKDNGGLQEEIYRVKEGTTSARLFPPGVLLIGNQTDNQDFTGIVLFDILTHQNGPDLPVTRYARLLPHLVLLEDFWDRYLEVGRCAIDPGHINSTWQDTRYHMAQGHTVCLWCKKTVSLPQHGIQHPR